MHIVGYRISSSTEQALVIDGRNFFLVPLLWLMALMGVAVSVGGIAVLVGMYEGQLNADGHTVAAVLLALCLIPTGVSLSVGVFGKGAAVRRVIRVSLPTNAIQIITYNAYGKASAKNVALGRPTKLNPQPQRMSSVMGPLWRTLTLSLNYADHSSVTLLGLDESPSLPADSPVAGSIVRTLCRLLKLPMPDQYAPGQSQ